MAESKVDLKKEVFSKSQYVKTIDTSFSELGITTINQDLQNQTTVTEFFNLYNTLFYDIPAEGETNSHRYLVEQSGEYINFDEVNIEIEALQAEITQLRKELLKEQMKNISGSIASTIPSESDAEFQKLDTELKNITQQVTSIPSE
jgi:hypothetical protein